MFVPSEAAENTLSLLSSASPGEMSRKDFFKVKLLNWSAPKIKKLFYSKM